MDSNFPLARGIKFKYSILTVIFNPKNEFYMARMHPEEIEELENPTEGERKVFRFLREVARPNADFIGWYEPAIGEQGREPDFVLFGNHHGLLVLEVKDWLIDQIEEADGFTLN